MTGLVEEPRAGSADLGRLWERRDVQPPGKTFRQPAVGADERR